MYRELLAIRREEPALRPGAARISVRAARERALDRDATRRARRAKPSRALQSRHERSARFRSRARMVPAGARDSPRSRMRSSGAKLALASKVRDLAAAVLRRTLTLERSPDMRVWPGQPYPLGATWDGEGVNFAIFSENATGVSLCLFDAHGDAKERERIPIARAQRPDLALLPSRCAPRTAVRLSRGRAVLARSKDIASIRISS